MVICIPPCASHRVPRASTIWPDSLGLLKATPALHIVIQLLIRTGSTYLFAMEAVAIAGSVVSLLSGATRICLLLYDFVTDTKDAPKTASQLLDEMNSFIATLEQLQVYLLGLSTSSLKRHKLTLKRDLDLAQTGCVITYSDLDSVVKKCVEGAKVKRLKWLLNKTKIEDILQRLQSNKPSLTIMLMVLQA
jgi:hypothetical protein